MNSLDQETVAVLAQITSRRLRQLHQTGDGPPRREDGRYDVKPVGAWLASRFNPEEASPQAARARLDRLRQQRREVLAVGDVKNLWSAEVGRAKARLLALPARTAPGLLGVEQLREVESRLRDAIIEALREVSSADGT